SDLPLPAGDGHGRHVHAVVYEGLRVDAVGGARFPRALRAGAQRAGLHVGVAVGNAEAAADFLPRQPHGKAPLCAILCDGLGTSYPGNILRRMIYWGRCTSIAQFTKSSVKGVTACQARSRLR